MRRLQQVHHAADQRFVVGLRGIETQLGAEYGVDGLRVFGQVGVDRSLRCIDIIGQRDQRLPKRIQIPVCDLRLHVVRVAAVDVAVIADVSTIERVDESEGTVVDRETEDRHVVGVQHAVAKPDALPLRHQPGGAARDLLEPREVRLLRVTAFWIKPRNHVVGQLPKGIVLLGPVKIFERAETDKAGRHAQRNRRRFDRFANHWLIGADHRQCARGRNSQMMQSLGAEKLANRRAQHGAAIAHARIRRLARSLQLQFPVLAGRPDGLAEQQRAPVAEPRHVNPELMSRVDGSQRIATRQQPIACHGVDEFRTLSFLCAEVHQRARGLGKTHEVGLR